MGKNGTKNEGDFVELGGWEIRKVKDGLDETQVTSLIKELTSQRDELTQRTEHIASLTRLAEKTVTEADELAKEMKTQALEQAKNETASLIAEAETRARQIENETRRIQIELKSSVQEIFNQLLSGLESLKQRVGELKTESEQKLSRPLNTAIPVTTKAADLAEPTPAVEKNQMPVIRDTVRRIAPQGDNLNLELEILPPLDIMKIMEIVTFLDNLPEVENTELIPNTERPSIIISLREPIDLMDMLSALPEIANLKDTSGPDAEESQPRKIQVSLSRQPLPQKAQKG